MDQLAKVNVLDFEGKFLLCSKWDYGLSDRSGVPSSPYTCY